MKNELGRQLVHLSGLLFVFLSQYVNKTEMSLLFFLIAFSTLSYSYYIRIREKKFEKFIERMESKFREFALSFERKESIRMPFRGAFWFYLSFGTAFLLFPSNIASASCSMLAVGDSLSVLIGKKLGRHVIINNKTAEGSVSCFLSSFLIGSIFVNIFMSVIGAVVATLSEIIPRIDDNLTIPILSGIAMLLSCYWLFGLC